MMLHGASGRLARLAFGAMLACAVTLLLADASSGAARRLAGTYSQSRLASICSTAGGNSYQGNDKYGCTTATGTTECDKNGKCTCTGSKCPAVVKEGNGIPHPPASAGTAVAAGSTTNTRKLPITNVDQQGAPQHSGAHSAGTKH